MPESSLGFLKVVAGEVDTPPRLIRGRSPIFPPRLVYEHVYTGSAVLHFTVTADGRAVDPRVISASHPQIAAGVAYVLPTWKIIPATKNGVPTEVTVEYGVSFSEAMGEFRSKK